MYGQPHFEGQGQFGGAHGSFQRGGRDGSRSRGIPRGGPRGGGIPRGKPRGGGTPRGTLRGGGGRGASRGNSTPRGGPHGTGNTGRGTFNRNKRHEKANFSNSNSGGMNGNSQMLWRFEGCFKPIAPFFVPSSFLLEMKRQVVIQCKTVKEVTPICQERARYAYMLKIRDPMFAFHNSGKQSDLVRAGKGYSCGICDIFTDTHAELKEHNETASHKEVMALFRKFDNICREWFKQSNDPSYCLSVFARDAEMNGLKINLNDVKSTVPSTPLNDLLFQDLDVATLNEEDFVLASYDSIMEVHWPKPVTEYYCRLCNYQSFLNGVQLENHKVSEEHKKLETNYGTSWCVSCQFHTGTPEDLVVHNSSSRHKMIVKMLEDVRVRALDYYKRQKAHLEKMKLQESSHRTQQFIHGYQSFERDSFGGSFSGFDTNQIKIEPIEPDMKKGRFSFQ